MGWKMSFSHVENGRRYHFGNIAIDVVQVFAGSNTFTDVTTLRILAPGWYVRAVVYASKNQAEERAKSLTELKSLLQAQVDLRDLD